MGISQNIKRLRKQAGMTQVELAEKLDVARSTITQWETGWSSPRMGMVQKLAGVFGVTSADMLAEDSEGLPSGAMPVAASSATVPLLAIGRVHAGALTDEEEVSHRVEVPSSVLSGHPRAFALEVEGDCMDRVIPEGSHVLVDPDREPGNGSIAVVETDSYQAVMRRWYRGSSTLMLTADSHSEQEDMVFGPEDGPVRVVGTVVWWQAPREME
ncbi:LexA family protein [Collinsella stercoris]|nr:XRE family transcriptional regulator [Collinsella stercoris]UEA45516.1 XRE family transcriptional regulator [Collinsella stercoris DSM 13279]UWP11960.1 XRE family transcriptional regulator [Collinsella stercoris]